MVFQGAESLLWTRARPACSQEVHFAPLSPDRLPVPAQDRPLRAVVVEDQALEDWGLPPRGLQSAERGASSLYLHSLQP